MDGHCERNIMRIVGLLIIQLIVFTKRVNIELN